MNASLAEKRDNYQTQAKHLGSAQFKQDYGIQYAYYSGAMYRGTASKELVVAMGKAGLMGFLGVGGLKLDRVEGDIDYIQNALNQDQAYGMNLLCDLSHPDEEMKTVELYLKKGIRNVEAAAFLQITPALAYYRLKGLRQDDNGNITSDHNVIAKVSRPEVAQAFMSPAPERIVNKLLEEGKVTQTQAEWAKSIPMSDDVCVEADSGGHTDQGVATVLFPAMQSLRKEIMAQYQYHKTPRIGLAGGIGTPQAAAAAFVMGADFIVTGSINQCTVESGASDTVKNMLQDINVQDTDYAPAGDMFEIGARVQVLKKGVFFPARANKLFTLYSHYDSLDDIPEKIQRQVQDKYFKKSFDEVWRETREYYESTGRAEIPQKIERNPKKKMAMVFRWYFLHSTRLAFAGDEQSKVDFQVHTGPALGAFNQWVKGTELQDWRQRHVHEIGEMLMLDTAELLSNSIHTLLGD